LQRITLFWNPWKSVVSAFTLLTACLISIILKGGWVVESQVPNMYRCSAQHQVLTRKSGV
jgi:hypothetical protein